MPTQVTHWLKPDESADTDIDYCSSCGCVAGIDHKYFTVKSGTRVEVTVECPAAFAKGPEKKLGITNLEWCQRLAAKLGGYVGCDTGTGAVAVFTEAAVILKCSE